MQTTNHSAHFLRVLMTAFLVAVLVASTGLAQVNFGGFSTGGDEKPAVTVRAELRPGSAPTRKMLYVEATVLPDHYIYAIDTPKGTGPVPTEVRVSAPQGVKIGQFRALESPKTKYSEAFGTEIRTHAGKVAWAAPVEFAPGVSPEATTLSGAVFAQACAEAFCVRPQEYPFTVRSVSGTSPADAGSVVSTIDDSEPAGVSGGVSEHEVPLLLPPPGLAATDPIPADSAQVSTVSFEPAELKTADAAIAAEPAEVAASEIAPGDSSEASLPWILSLAFLGGLLLNLMPCVLPVIGLKVLSFVEQSGHNRARALWLNAWYSLGLLSVFWILAGLAAFLGFGWGQLFTYGGFNIALAAVVFTMGLSFLGVWEIPIPGFVGSGRMAELGQKEGAAGAFSKGMITTVLATPCTAPLLGTALAWALRQPPAEVFLVFTAVGLGMAAPYLLAGAFPAVTGFLPKPGAWMDTFKQLMGFVLLATVVYLLTILKWYYAVPTVGFLFGLWGACWWIGRTPITATSGTKSARWAGAGTFAVVVWFLMFAGSPMGLADFDQPAPFRGLAAVMRDRVEDKDEWRPFSEATLKSELAQGKPVLIDFTADWCLVCKTLEATVLNAESVKSAVKRHEVSTLKADWTHGDPAVTEMLERLGSKQVPVIAIFSPDAPNQPVIFRGGMTEQMLLDALRQAGTSG